nr:MAG TPA: hypothetical protein [Caudoviricetes sp.]
MIIVYQNYGRMSIGKLHKDFAKKLLNFSVLHKFRPKRLSPAGQFYHTSGTLSSSKIAQKMS